MLSDLENQLQEVIKAALKDVLGEDNVSQMVEIEIPSDKSHGDYSTNIALKSAKILRKAPPVIAKDFVELIESAVSSSPLKDIVIKIEIKNPGFINFFMASDAFSSVLDQILSQKENFGRIDEGKGEKIQIEFVSANPTGPLSVAHARQAVVGDVLAESLKFIGFDVTKEYYVNDGGNQINILGSSIEFRVREIFGETIDFPEDGYQGDYIKDMAQMYIDKHHIKAFADIEGQDESPKDFGVEYLLGVITKDLEDFNVNFDVWSYESKIATKEAILKVLEDFASKKLTYESEGALWFRTTDFGDDKDRVLRKSDGSYTYLTPDIAYHKNKFDRGFETIANIWGPDHHGYIARIQAAACAMGKDKESIKVLIVQLATIYREGQAISMSTRKGEFISLREVIDEVGVDAARFFFLMRHIKVHLDFDLELAKKNSSENPVYYIQYAHARIFSINKKAVEAGIKTKESGFSLLKEPAEINLIKKC
ncbi:Arginyl-tRNA synthetase, partial [hydrothermal vent metagenome]